MGVVAVQALAELGHLLAVHERGVRAGDVVVVEELLADSVLEIDQGVADAVNVNRAIVGGIHPFPRSINL